jgi:DNA-binding GntR family transcriptional regulator
MNRGIFVPVLTSADVADIYKLRRLIEGGAARLAGAAPMTARLAVRATVELGETAAATGRWFEVRTADLRFHQAIAALADSPRTDDLMRRALAELRLIFHVMADPEQFHGPYLKRNRVIADEIVRGDGQRAEAELLSYLTDAERQILAVYQVPAPDSAS